MYLAFFYSGGLGRGVYKVLMELKMLRFDLGGRKMYFPKLLRFSKIFFKIKLKYNGFISHTKMIIIWLVSWNFV